MLTRDPIDPPRSNREGADRQARLIRPREAISHRQLLPAACIAGLAFVAALVRLPFLATGLGPDEGGYAYVAERWAHGARLYHAAWVDRPQGLLLAYRFFLRIGDTPWAVRLGAIVFACAITVLVGTIGWLLQNARTGITVAGI